MTIRLDCEDADGVPSGVLTTPLMLAVFPGLDGYE